LAAVSARAAEPRKPLRIRIFYALHAPVQPRADWPNVGFNFQPVMDRFVPELRARCPGFEFEATQASDEPTAKAALEADKNGRADGYIVYQLNCWNRVVQPVAATGKPTLLIDFPFGGSGGVLVYASQFMKSGTPNVGFVASPQMDDIAAAVRCFSQVAPNGADFAARVASARRAGTPVAGALACTADPVATLSPKDCLAKMREAKLLVVTDRKVGNIEAIRQQMGIDVIPTAFDELNAAWQAADKDEAKAVADRWKKTAKAIVDVSRETLETSAAMYLGEKALLKKHGAIGLTVNCLGGFYGGHIHAYPCLGFHELNNEGLIGGCEADVQSASTMIAMTTLTQGRPGYISDPILDTSKRQIVYAHCVASNRPFGPQGPANPFEILTHSEDRQGAAVRSLFPSGYMTTSVEFSAPKKQILFHQAKAVANLDDDRACRTKLVGEPVGDFEKLFTKWCDWGWHRVTVFGDLKEPVFALADALGWEVVREA